MNEDQLKSFQRNVRKLLKVTPAADGQSEYSPHHYRFRGHVYHLEYESIVTIYFDEHYCEEDIASLQLPESKGEAIQLLLYFIRSLGSSNDISDFTYRLLDKKYNDTESFAFYHQFLLHDDPVIRHHAQFVLEYLHAFYSDERVLPFFQYFSQLFSASDDLEYKRIAMECIDNFLSVLSPNLPNSEKYYAYAYDIWSHTFQKETDEQLLKLAIFSIINFIKKHPSLTSASFLYDLLTALFQTNSSEKILDNIIYLFKTLNYSSPEILARAQALFLTKFEYKLSDINKYSLELFVQLSSLEEKKILFQLLEDPSKDFIHLRVYLHLTQLSCSPEFVSRYHQELVSVITNTQNDTLKMKKYNTCLRKILIQMQAWEKNQHEN